VVCVDNDPQALTATNDNADRNSVQDVISSMLPGEFSTQRAGVVLANILAAPLVELAPRLAGAVGAGGALVLSGILEEQAEEVRATYLADFPGMKMRVLDGWVLLTGTRPE
jgi:ribosomal protein L11 methyltransferase